MSAVDQLAEGAFKLATMVADAISEKTGVGKAVTYPLAIEAAKAYVAAERRAVTDARAAAKARVKK